MVRGTVNIGCDANDKQWCKLPVYVSSKVAPQ
jgi:hypothetical protein